MKRSTFILPSQEPVRCRCWKPTAPIHDYDCPMGRALAAAEAAELAAAETAELVTSSVTAPVRRPEEPPRSGSTPRRTPRPEPEPWLNFLPPLRGYPWSA